MDLRNRVIAAGLAIIATSAFAADQALIDAAKKEGQATWYTTQIVNQFVDPAAKAFEKKYGIKVNYVRTGSSEGLLRVINEAKAGAVQADAIDGTGMAALVKSGLALQWQPDAVKRLPAQYFDKNGYWTATNLYVRTSAFNTDLVPRGTEPKTYEDLLNPKWKGKMVWPVGPDPTSVPGFIGVVLREMGQDKGLAYLKALAAQQITPLQVSPRQVVDQTMAGEFAIAVHVNNSHVTISRNEGAPVDWIRMNPAIGIFSIIAGVKGSPHPNAGKLLIDFLVSREGQELYAAADYLPVDPDVKPRDPSLRPDGVTWRANYILPDEVEETVSGWWKLYQELFR